MMKPPRVLHLRVSTVIDPDPSVKNSRQNLQEKKNDQLRIVEIGAVEEFYFGDQPGKEDKVCGKE